MRTTANKHLECFVHRDAPSQKFLGRVGPEIWRAAGKPGLEKV
jgi:hypothetical protein